MVLFNYSTKELTAKVVYYGPGLGGKTTNLQWIHEKLPIKNKGKMLSLATETDRTLFFDFLPIELGTIRGMRTRVQLYTVPGQVFYNATRRMVLKGADSVVLVADSQEAMLEANLEAMENLRQNLEANEIDPDEIPMVMQYNKRDLPNALPIEILNEKLNARGAPFVEAVAIRGVGVEDTLKTVTALVFRSLASKYGGGEATSGQTPSAPRPVTGPPPSPVAAPSPPTARPTVSPTIPTTTLPPHAVEASDLVLDIDLENEPSQDEAVLAEEEELSLETEEEEEALPPPPPIPAPLPRPAVAKSTLVRQGAEVADLRGRIAEPLPEPDLSLDQIEDEEEDLTELSLETPLPRPPPAAAPPPRVMPPRMAAAPLETSKSVVPSPLTPAPGQLVPVTVAPVAVSVPSLPGGTTVTIPVEVTARDGTARVSVQVQIVLDIRLKSANR